MERITTTFRLTRDLADRLETVWREDPVANQATLEGFAAGLLAVGLREWEDRRAPTPEPEPENVLRFPTGREGS